MIDPRQAFINRASQAKTDRDAARAELARQAEIERIQHDRQERITKIDDFWTKLGARGLDRAELEPLAHVTWHETRLGPRPLGGRKSEGA